jgi:hypothetical protein
MREWWIIDRRTDRAVNVVSTSKPQGPDVSVFLNGEHLYATLSPTDLQRRGYQYWGERP